MAVPLPPAPCDVQIWPAVTSFALFSDGNGDLSFAISVPAGVWNFDWTFQIGQLSGADISMTNPLLVGFR